jgi:hypothetical protein
VIFAIFPHQTLISPFALDSYHKIRIQRVQRRRNRLFAHRASSISGKYNCYIQIRYTLYVCVVHKTTLLVLCAFKRPSFACLIGYPFYRGRFSSPTPRETGPNNAAADVRLIGVRLADAWLHRLAPNKRKSCVTSVVCRQSRRFLLFIRAESERWEYYNSKTASLIRISRCFTFFWEARDSPLHRQKHTFSRRLLPSVQIFDCILYLYGPLTFVPNRETRRWRLKPALKH